MWKSTSESGANRRTFNDAAVDSLTRCKIRKGCAHDGSLAGFLLCCRAAPGASHAAPHFLGARACCCALGASSCDSCASGWRPAGFFDDGLDDGFDDGFFGGGGGGAAIRLGGGACLPVLFRAFVASRFFSSRLRGFDAAADASNSARSFFESGCHNPSFFGPARHMIFLEAVFS